MTTEEKFEDAERNGIGYYCGVSTCPYCINGRATCGDYCEDHCTKSLFHELTDAKRKIYEEDDDGNRIIVDNPYVYQSEAVIPLEPWVKTQDIIDLNHGLVKLPQQDKKGNRQMKTCDLIKCPLNRVVTVHEIGYAEKNYYDDDIYKTPPYFVSQYPRVRHFTLHAFKEIDGFCLPTMKFEKVRKPGWKGFVLSDDFKWTQTGEVTGGWIRLDNGQTIYVKETLEELKELIEGNAKEEAK